MTTDRWNDYRWLVSADGTGWLARLRGTSTPLVTLTRQLRKSLSATQTHLLLEQLQLQQRAAVKFDAAHRLFFTPRALEQATDQWIAAYKAARFPQGQEIADLCCGIGGDLFGLARRGHVTGVDSNPIHALLAEENCRALGLPSYSIQTADATTIPLPQYAAWHIDPDRRTAGHRTTRLTNSQPSLAALEQMRQQQPDGAVKLAPAAVVPQHWAPLAERQWIGSGRECRQQVVWFGKLAQYPGQHSAQVVHHRNSDSRCLVGTPNTSVPVAGRVADFVCEPHAVVLAAQLTANLAADHDLSALDAKVAYLTSERPIEDLLLSCFAVLDIFPLDIRKLRTALQARHIGQLEVKKRSVPLDPDTVRKQLQGRGDQSATLLITPLAGSIRAILCQRLPSPSD